MDDVFIEVIDSSDYENGNLSRIDIASSIGRVLCDRLGIER